MINKLFTQMIYRIVFCVISGLACVLTLGFFRETYGTDYLTISNNFWQYYTNISNYICFGIGVAVCAATVKRVKAGETEGHNKCCQTLKFCATVMILVTFLVYASLLGDVTSPSFWNSLGNLTYHVAAPILFILDWFLFDEHKTVKILDPLKATIMPLIYVVYILIYGAIYKAAAGEPFSYPYFFLNVNDLGYGGVVLWVFILVVVFVVLGYLMFIYDKLVKDENGKWKFDFKNLKLI
ncbi:MAG: Pr6Pr family membrane protein [Clostridia bacterium]|nr:Pr6Pr family membrane protein [Clostridia bacterium]